MESAAKPVPELPNDIEALKALVREQAQEKQRLQAKVISLQEQINLLLHKRFGVSSEKYSPDQLPLFNDPLCQHPPRGLSDTYPLSSRACRDACCCG